MLCGFGDTIPSSALGTFPSLTPLSLRTTPGEITSLHFRIHPWMVSPASG